MSDIIYDPSEEPILLSKHLMDILLAQPNSGRLLLLYCFYYKTAKWQGTNQPRATVEYVAKGLNWSCETVSVYKKKLIKLNLIKSIVRRNENNQIIGHYVKVNFIWVNSDSKSDVNNSDDEVPRLRKSHHLATLGGNSYNNIYIPVINDGETDISFVRTIPSKKNKDKNYLPIAKYLALIVRTTKNIKISNQTINSWASEIRKLHKMDGVDIKRIKKALEWYGDHAGEQYIPVIESGSSFRKKFTKLEDAIKRSNQPITHNIKPKYYDGIEYIWDPKRNNWFTHGGTPWDN